MDETGWWQKKERHWLWLVASTVTAYFVIEDSRKGDVARDLLGEECSDRIVVTDRHGGYNFIDDEYRQLCWAHLGRDLVGLIEYGGETARLARLLLKEEGGLFAAWHLFKVDDSISRAEFQAAVSTIRMRVGRYLKQGARLPTKSGGRKFKAIQRHFRSLFTFVDVEDVQPTNNHAERLLRRPVIWRRLTQGTRTDAGSKFVSRMLSVCTTLRLRGHRILEYLQNAIVHAGRGQPVEPIPQA
jgi:transposase